MPVTSVVCDRGQPRVPACSVKRSQLRRDDIDYLSHSTPVGVGLKDVRLVNRSRRRDAS